MTEPAAITIDEATLRLHGEQLSSTARAFLEHVQEHPHCFDRASFLALEATNELQQHPLQSWPTFVGPAKLAELRAAAEGLCRLIRRLPAMVFDGDPRRIAEFYGLEEERAELIARALASGHGIDHTIARGDFLDTADGLRCLEFNMGANLGGWESALWAGAYLQVPAIRAFLEESEVSPRFQDTGRLTFEHIVGSTLDYLWGGEGLGDEGLGDENLTLALALHPNQLTAEPMRLYLESLLRQILDARGVELTGRVLFTTHDQLHSGADGVYRGETRVHAVIEYYSYGKFSPEVHERLLDDSTRFFNGPAWKILDDKRNLALLSEREDSPELSAAERELIRAHVPWTRRIEAGPQCFGGEEGELTELLERHREALVIKPADKLGGVDVMLGHRTPPEDWRGAVERALGEGGWLVQERIESRPYLYQSGDSGAEPFEVVWGPFVFGSAYGGCCLRMVPQAKEGIVNETHGAVSGILFEVPEARESKS